jgi:site-specific recombinase XerD
MLERYFIRPATLDRIRASWLGDAIEQYATWLTEQDYAARNIFIRIPILTRFGEFTRQQGANNWKQLPDYVEPFVRYTLKQSKTGTSKRLRGAAANGIRNPVQQLLRLILPEGSNIGLAQHGPDPFIDSAPSFFSFLRNERGLREATLVQYRHYLRLLEEYLRRLGVDALSDLSPSVISAVITESGKTINKRSVQSLCSILKVFLRYLYHTGVLARDLSEQIESPRHYRLSNLPRSISVEQVRQTLEAVDQRDAVGKRDYAILLLLVTYGLRAREVAALTLDDFDWKRDRLHVPGRKAGHSAIFPLSPVVGEAVLAYLQHGRPKTEARAMFFRVFAPYTPLGAPAVSARAKRYLRKAGIKIARPGSHTLRHTCVQRLVDAHVPLKTIGDYLGHRTPDATNIYAKVNIEALREVALSDVEEIL